MANPTLRRGDGFANQSPDKREDVRRMQTALKNAGYDVDADGLFGEGTERQVIAFQKARGLGADGIVGPATWSALGGANDSASSAAYEASNVLPGFRGDAAWVHAREGHAGKAYWPGGASGVTFDPGVDLGHAKSSLIEQHYKPILTTEQFAAAQKAFGVKGASAKQHLDSDSVLQSIRISRAQADTIFPYASLPYWNAIVNRFPTLDDSDTLGSVQTALLSLAYNRGAGNRGLETLKQPLADKNWTQVADRIGSMQQDHQLAGIRKRRRMEAELIRNELDANT